MQYNDATGILTLANPNGLVVGGQVVGSSAATWGSITGSIASQADLQNLVDQGVTHTKNLTVNASNNLFTFPLANGEGIFLFLNLSMVVKKGSDIGIEGILETCSFVNNGGSLLKDFENGGNGFTSVSATAGITGFGTESFTASLSGGIVTVSINPGTPVSFPDSIVLNLRVNTIPSKTLTYL